MKIIFLDFDGVLNSAASFMVTSKARKGLEQWQKDELPPVNEHLDPILAHNFQFILDRCPDAKVVISSTWRNLFDLEWLKSHLSSYGIDSSRVIDKTPSSFNRSRGSEINDWLEDHPEVTHYTVIDDNYIGHGMEENGKVVATSWYVGLTLHDALKAIEMLEGDDSFQGIPL